jgi:hydroxymethylpyrimidine/phosphomethylpyrimidine kinase
MDPSAGAGILRDVLTLGSLGVAPMALSLADTVQNGEGCRSIHPPRNPMPALEALAPHLGGPWGVKLGMCALDAPALEAVVDFLEAHAPEVRIWDPIQAPTAGTGLHDPRSLGELARTILARPGWVASPNLREAAALSGLPSPWDPGRLAAPFLDLGAHAIIPNP